MEKHKKSPVIINDRQFLSYLLERLLRDRGFDPINSFTDVKISLEYILAHPLDLVIIDMTLPIMRTRENGDVNIFHPYILMDNQTSFKTVIQICESCLDTKVLLLTGDRHPHTFHSGFEGGTHGIASKLDSFSSFLIILQRLKTGEEQIVFERMQILLDGYKRSLIPALSLILKSRIWS